MGHLFAIGGSTSDSEQSIYVGNLGDIGAGDFPDTFDYIALGHLHRPQKVGKQNHIRYSGTPYILSFSEVGHEKNVLVLESKGGKIAAIDEVEVPAFRAIFRVGGTLEKCLAELYDIDKQEHELTPWVEVLLDNNSNTSIGFSEVNKVAENLKLEVLKVMLKTTRKTEGIDQLMASTKDIKALSPFEIFKLKCKEQDFDLDAHEEITDAFNEVLQIVRKA
jgi:exonuclease SbcD